MMFAKLSETEQHLISSYIEEYARGDVTASRSREASLEKILHVWDEAKSEYLDKVFGGQLILSKQVTFEKDQDEMIRELETSMWRGSMQSFKRELEALVWNDGAASRALRNHACDVLSLINAGYMARNRYEGCSYVIPTPDGKEIQVQNGCKPLKVLGKIAQAYRMEHFEDFRLEHSRILNQKVLRGELCLSIHPMDFMTMSDNECDWESCMSWMNYGSYRRGTVEMMNSKSVVVAYLKAKEDMRFFNQYWANKKWRSLFIVTPNFISNVKGYPYQSDPLAAECCKWLAELAHANCGWEYKDKVLKYDHETWFDDQDGEKWKLCFESWDMYNDFGSIEHTCVVAAHADTNYEHRYDFTYSGPATCMFCGHTGCDYDEEGALCCCDCAECYYCTNCGDRIMSDDMYEIDGAYYCHYCYQDHAVECPITEETHYDNNLVPVYLTSKPNEVDRWHDSCINVYEDGCYDCPDRMKQLFPGLGSCQFRETREMWRVIYYVNPEDCSPDGLALFNIMDEAELKEYLGIEED